MSSRVDVYLEGDSGPWAATDEGRFSISCWNEGGRSILAVRRAGGPSVTLQGTDSEVIDGAEAVGRLGGIELSAAEVQEAIVVVRSVIAARLLAELRVSEMMADSTKVAS